MIEEARFVLRVRQHPPRPVGETFEHFSKGTARAVRVSPSPRSAWHAQPDHGDDVALDLIRPTPEGEDRLRPGLLLQATSQDGPRRTLDQVARLSDHLEQLSRDLQREL